jgi:NADH-quinone oxidoreductase subunit C
MVDGKETIELLRKRFPEAVVVSDEWRGQHWAQVRAVQFVEVCEWLRDDPATAFDLLLDMTAVHWPEDRQPMELVYHLYSTSRNDRLRVKLRTGDEGPVPTLADLWKSAEWLERETFDMFGIRFEGHPDLRRILMPDDYTDFPLRKEFPLYRG